MDPEIPCKQFQCNSITGARKDAFQHERSGFGDENVVST